MNEHDPFSSPSSPSQESASQAPSDKDDAKPPSKSWFSGSFFAAFMVAASVGAWLASGFIQRANENLIDNLIDPKEVKTKPLPLVQTKTFIAEKNQPEIIIRGGRVEAERSVIVRAELSGKVDFSAIDKKGTFIKQGTLLCGIEVNSRRDEREEAQSQMQLRQLQLSAAEKLAKQGHSTRISLAQSLANYNQAKAQLARAERALKNTKITAPFDGILEDVFVNQGDFMNPSTPCARVIDMSPLILSGEVTEEEVVKLNPDAIGWALIPQGKRLEGKIRYIAHSADSKTRTYRVELEAFDSLSDLDISTIRDGLTVEIHVPLKPVLAHKIQPSILTLNDKGQLGLRIVAQQDGNYYTHFKPVTIIKGDSQDYWVTGLDNQVEIIVVGQEYVKHGTQVAVRKYQKKLAQPKNNPLLKKRKINGQESP